MDRFISREPQVSSDNHTLGHGLDSNVDNDPSDVDPAQTENNIGADVDQTQIKNNIGADVDQTQTENNVGAEDEEDLLDNRNIDMDDPPVAADGIDSFQPDILIQGHVCIEESFLGFLEVTDTTGQGLFDAVDAELKRLDLDIDNVRGQGYDNGANMKGDTKGYKINFWM
ncbi:hypothetical protein PR202_gb23580 [Eleusine coracana subsp. coracana]|uniref:Uncharacterized protein n=1 Tax=Eleusine coracana subsp. coracana TaxID=191504 RepID=A0AAV5FJ13_ELECO|nr:hypothetical protein PR202_gb23580 [Eleusine coracana subsp. coracana]